MAAHRLPVLNKKTVLISLVLLVHFSPSLSGEHNTIIVGLAVIDNVLFIQLQTVLMASLKSLKILLSFSQMKMGQYGLVYRL